MVWTNVAIDILLFIFVVDCAFMGLVIMMQRSKQEGLGAAFGGGMMSDTFGPQASSVLVKATVWAAVIFFALSITLARLYSHQEALSAKGSTVQQMLEKTVAPATPAPTATPVTPTTAPAPVTPTTPAPVSSTTAPAPAAPKATASPATATPTKP